MFKRFWNYLKTLFRVKTEAAMDPEIEIAVVDALERICKSGNRFGAAAFVHGVALSQRLSGSRQTTSPR